MNTANQILCVAASLLALSAAPLHAQTNCSPPPSGLVAWWPAEGNYNDFVGTNDGTLVGSASYVTGNVGSAWNLPGNGYITVPSAANLRPPQFTIECWIKPANTGRPRYTADVDTIVQTYSGSAGFWLGLCWDTNYTYLGFSSKVPQGTIAFYVWITGAGFTLLYAPPVPADGLFHHVAASVDDSSMNIYLDGALAATRARPAGAVVHSTRPFSIGRADDAAMDRQAAAAIDELSFYNRTLSPVELASIFTAGSAGKCSSGPPNIVLQPQSQNVVWSQSATFTVGATGTKPFAYQWQFQNTNLPAATNAALVLPAVSTNQAGNYRVIITNSLGSVTSAVAVLTGSLSAGYWTGGGDGASWNVAANWSGGVVPGPTNDVIITDGAGTNVVISSGSITVKSIQCSKAFTISGGSLTVTTNNSLLSGTLTLVSGTALSATGFAAVLVATGKATADGANLYASGGATLSLPGLTSYDAPDVGYATYRLRASGAGSVLSLPNLTNVIGNSSYSGYVIVEALAGGLVNLSNVVAISQPCLLDGNQNSYARGVQVLADGTNSVVDLSALVSFVDVAPLHASRLEARTGGTIWMGKAASMDGVEVRLDGTGLDEPLLGSFTRGALSVTGAAVDWSGATNFTGSALSVGSGGSVNLSNLVDLRNGAVTLSGGGTANLTGVRLLDGASLIVSNGVTLSLPGVTSYDAPDVGYATYRLRASGAGSVLSLPNLTNVIGNASYSGYLIVEALGGGLVNLSNVVAISQPCLLDGNQNYYARGVQVLAEGTNSVVDLRALVSFVDVAPLHASRLEARTGGTIWMGKTASLDGVEVRLNATGSLGLPALRSYTRGSLSVNGQAVDWNGVTNFNGSVLSVGSGGSVNLSGVTTFSSGALTVDGGGSVNLSNVVDLRLTTVVLGAGAVTPDLGRVRMLDGANLTVSNGVTLSLPMVTSYDAPDVGATTNRLRASGAGSVLSLPNVANVVGNNQYLGYLMVEALAGGQVNLSNMVTITQPCLFDGNVNYARGVQVLADGINSVVDLRSLSGLISLAPNSASSLTAQNGGVILLNDRAFLLSNVAINIPPGNPVLPPTLVVSSTLNLYGKAWHSYWVEQRDTRFADSPWVFTARVPLTNAFQAFASAPPANTAYRVSEFVADPAILDLNRVSKTNVQMVLYGALSKSFEVQTTNSFDRLPPAWSTWATTGAMTNSFRIFPPFTPSGPQRFYRGKEL